MREVLESILAGISKAAIAVSGGVDSVTLAAVANGLGRDVVLMHATSPAVPVEATTRVRRLAAERGWHLMVFEAGEFADAAYRANPVDRCFFCKTNLYGAIRSRTDRPILSGANLDDLGEYRPGLDAARLHNVRHPYIEARVTKDGVRQIARELGLDDVAELPSSPCLSSRIETGIRIEPEALAFIAGVERVVTREIRPATVRCRIRSSAVVIELDAPTLDRLTAEQTSRLTALISRQWYRPAEVGESMKLGESEESKLTGEPEKLTLAREPEKLLAPSQAVSGLVERRQSMLPVSFERYRNGSAFLRERP